MREMSSPLGLYGPRSGRAEEAYATVTTPQQKLQLDSLMNVCTGYTIHQKNVLFERHKFCAYVDQKLGEESSEELTLWNPEVPRVPESQESPFLQTRVIGQVLN
jgi:hypothetical protein